MRSPIPAIDIFYMLPTYMHASIKSCTDADVLLLTLVIEKCMHACTFFTAFVVLMV